MTTVTAKQLRENLSMYLDRMEAGEEIAVIRHSEIIGRLKPAKASTSRYNGASVGKRLDALLKNLPPVAPELRDPNKTYKQLRDEMYRTDPKYQKYLSK